jgi:hypothetical protein
MANSNLSIQPYSDGYASIEDHRWRVNNTGMKDGQNGVLAIDATLKADGPHKRQGWVLSGVPLYKGDDKKLHLFDDKAVTDGEKVFGFLMSPVRIADYNGGFYDEAAVAVQTRGEIIYDWLPVQVPLESLSDRFGITQL